LEEGFIPLEEIKDIPLLDSVEAIEKRIASLQGKMRIFAKKLDFEEAARIRDEISGLRKRLIVLETGEF
jgi:excinuclease UvrABC helicase subunit UvrB